MCSLGDIKVKRAGILVVSSFKDVDHVNNENSIILHENYNVQELLKHTSLAVSTGERGGGLPLVFSVELSIVCRRIIFLVTGFVFLSSLFLTLLFVCPSLKVLHICNLIWFYHPSHIKTKMCCKSMKLNLSNPLCYFSEIETLVT